MSPLSALSREGDTQNAQKLHCQCYSYCSGRSLCLVDQCENPCAEFKGSEGEGFEYQYGPRDSLDIQAVKRCEW